MTAAYTPQQNGVAERKNRTIMNAVRSMLSERQVPKTFWSEAARWSVHIQNRSPTAALEDVTPEEAWGGTKPIVDYFRVFGCVAHVHIPDQRRIKLDDKSKKCVFLGVSDESKAWRLYDPTTEKIVVSKDVIFEEEKGWDWIRTAEEIKRDILECEGETNQEEETAGEVAAGEDTETEVAVGDDAEIGPIGLNNPTESPPRNTIVSPRGASSSNQVRVTRERRAPGWHADYELGENELEEEEGDLNALMMMMMVAEQDPTRFEDADKLKIWKEAMVKEIESIEKNQTWELMV